MQLIKSLEYLSSEEALLSIKNDPYWPKWDSPWWHLMLLYELGEIKKAPDTIIELLADKACAHYLDFFPIDDIPDSVDLYRNILCFCAAGSLYQMLSSYGIDVDKRIPWLREWFVRYQLSDGGYNCDENAYRKKSGKSSIVSTLPVLEALLYHCKDSLTTQEHNVLQKGALYLLKHKLFRRLSDNKVIDYDWLEVRFPRFYDYDFLRGYSFLCKWREYSGFVIPDDLTDEVEGLMETQIENDVIILKHYNFFDKRSYNPNNDGSWEMGEASEFELFKSVSYDDAECLPLTKIWNKISSKHKTTKASHTGIYDNPVKLKAGDTLRILKGETSEEWSGWLYCRDKKGTEGWVPEKILKQDGQSVLVLQDYNAIELDVKYGDLLKIYFDESGWSWCRDKHGKSGWVPSDIF